MLDSVKAILATVNTIVRHAIAIMLKGVVLMVFLQVFCRYVLEYGLPWTEELARLFFTWMCLLGFSVCVYEKSNLGIEFVINRLNPAGKKAFMVLSQSLMLFLFGVMIFSSGKLASVVSMQTSATMGYNMAWPYASVLCGSILSFIYTLVNLIDVLCDRYAPGGGH
jgi:TRAP-type C4-dicarboxylate transport system, small permease component